MNVKEFKEFLNQYNDNYMVIHIIYDYLNTIATPFEIKKITEYSVETLVKIMNKYFYKSANYKEQLSMTNMYLKGEMYKDEEYARQMLPKQIQNIEEVLKDES